jgi:HD-GYP domain-containing protein (c-di-GMP phosphodiesterase class II)
MQWSHIVIGMVGGAAISGLVWGAVYYKKLIKSVKKQNFQLNTIEQLYNEVQRASSTIDKNVIESIQALVQALEARDSYTKGHSERVNKYSMVIGRSLGLSNQELDILHDASLLHDIGKIGVYDRILLKPSGLTAQEFELMRSHPDLAANILSSLTFLKEHLPLIQHHHERQDGSGYPRGLRGDEIPLGARIIQVADTWDAMTSDRPYRRRMSTEVALKELHRSAGTQLDERCVAAFTAWVRETRQIVVSAETYLN